MKTIIDSNIWISFFNTDDSNHIKAQDLISNVLKDNIYLTEYIILEVVTILLQKAGKQKADIFLDFATNSSNIVILHSSKLLFNNFTSFFQENSFLKLSFIDQSLVYLSKDFEVLTFDKELLKILQK